MSTIEELQKKVKQLEAELTAVRNSNKVGREKIVQMSSEVVDSNPYRYRVLIILISMFNFKFILFCL